MRSVSDDIRWRSWKPISDRYGSRRRFKNRTQKGNFFFFIIVADKTYETTYEIIRSKKIQFEPVNKDEELESIVKKKNI